MKKRVLVAGILVVGLAVSAGLFVLYHGTLIVLESAGVIGTPYVRAIYEDMTFGGTTKNDLSSFAPRRIKWEPPIRVPAIYVILRDEGPFFLPELPEEVAAKFATDRDEAWDGNPNDTHYSTLNSEYLLYRDGKLIDVIFTAMSGIRFGPTKDGPFLELPVSKKELERAFGPPLRWEHGRTRVHWY